MDELTAAVLMMVSLCTAATILGVSWMIYLNSQNRHVHQWVKKAMYPVNIYEKNCSCSSCTNKSLPVAHETHILLECSGCGYPITKTVDGRFEETS